MEKEKKILFQALKEYFRPELFDILSKCKIINSQGVYDFILDSIAEFGWRLGLDHIRNKITHGCTENFSAMSKELLHYLNQPQQQWNYK